MNRKKIITILVVMLVQTVGFTQVLPPPVPPPPPPGLPINGYSLVLIIVGIIYGVNKIFKS